MPIFSYQSFNANSSNVHDLKSLTAQRFTLDTHQHWAKRNGDEKTALVYPIALPDSSGVTDHTLPVQGPANLVATAASGAIDGLRTDHFSYMMTQKVLQNRQALYREMGAMADVTAFGELDSAHPDFREMTHFAGAQTRSSSNAKANQNFSVFAANGAKALYLADGVGWYAIDYLGYVVVFVHVPNDIAGGKGAKPLPKSSAAVIAPKLGSADPKRDKKLAAAASAVQRAALKAAKQMVLVKFYSGIRDRLLKDHGRIIDVVMGDTNQKTDSVTPEAVTKATGMPFKNAHGAGPIVPIDTFGVDVKGTNSTQKEPYDVAVYNAQTVKVQQLKYWTQQAPFGDSGMVASVTDHMGLAIKVVKI